MRAPGSAPGSSVFHEFPSCHQNITFPARNVSLCWLTSGKSGGILFPKGGKCMIGANLQKLRKQKGMTQETLAEAVGVARQTVAKWETEESAPDLETSARLAAVLNVSLDDLVNAPEGELDGKPGMQGKHMFGVVTVGDKGQIVIPVRARRVFHINPGDQLMVLGDENSGLALVNADFFLRMTEGIKNGF